MHPKFDTGAAENLWRAALWPPLLYTVYIKSHKKLNAYSYLKLENLSIKLKSKFHLLSNSHYALGWQPAGHFFPNVLKIILFIH